MNYRKVSQFCDSRCDWSWQQRGQFRASGCDFLIACIARSGMLAMLYASLLRRGCQIRVSGGDSLVDSPTLRGSPLLGSPLLGSPFMGSLVWFDRLLQFLFYTECFVQFCSRISAFGQGEMLDFFPLWLPVECVVQFCLRIPAFGRGEMLDFFFMALYGVFCAVLLTNTGLRVGGNAGFFLFMALYGVFCEV